MMTTGERIAQKRKEAGLSQEQLGQELGVSRQAVYKWECDETLPEIEKLVALAKRFAVPVGWLLGVEDEENGAEQSDELTAAELRMIEEIIRRYQPAPAAPAKKRRWWPVVTVAAVVLAVLLCRKLDVLQRSYNDLQNRLLEIQYNVGQRIDGITWQVQQALEQQAKFTSSYKVEVRGADLAANTVTFAVEAVPKTYVAGMTARLLAENGEDTVTAPMTPGENQKFAGEITCSLTNKITVSLVFTSGEKEETQILKTVEGLLRESFPLEYWFPGSFTYEIEDDRIPAKVYDMKVYPQKNYPGLPQAAKVGAVVQILEGETVLTTMEPTEKPDSGYIGDWSEYVFFRNPTEILLDRSKTYQARIVVVDEYGRQWIYCQVGFAYDADWDGWREQETTYN